MQAQVVLASTDEVAAAVDIASKAQKEWAATNPQARARVMMRFVDLVNENMDELATKLSLEHGKTFPDAKGDVQRGIEVIEFSIGIPHLLKGEFTEGAGAASTCIRCASRSASSRASRRSTSRDDPAVEDRPGHRLWQRVHPQTVRARPSVPVMLAELFTQAGLPDGVLQVVQGDKEAVDALLNHPDVKALGFVGSSDIAQYIYATSAANGKRSQCFGGAKNHMVILPDADLDQAVDALVGAGYGSAGERCMAISVAVPVGEATANALRES